MDTVKINAGNTKIIAHRGVSKLECENTNAAFVAAGNRSYFGIETDIHITADGKFAVIHDDNVMRVSGEDIEVEKVTLEKLREIHLYDKEEGVTRSDLVIPTLEEYIRICKRYCKIAVLELKNFMQPSDIARCIKIIEDLEYLENTVFISFVWENVAEIKNLLHNQKVQFLTGDECDDTLIERLKAYKMDLDIHYKKLDEKLVEKLHANGIEVNCWTCDEKLDAEELVSWGVDYITSNILE